MIARNLQSLHFEPISSNNRASFYLGRYDLPHAPFFWHYHPEVEIAFVLKGQGLRFVGESIETFHDGDLCLLGEKLPHSLLSTPLPQEKCCSMVIQFLPHFAGPDFFKQPEMKSIGQLLQRARRGLHFHGQTQRVVSQRLRTIMKSGVGHWRQFCDLIDILGTLAESTEYTFLNSSNPLPVGNNKVNRRVGQILDFVNTDPGFIPSQNEAARHVGLSPQAFSRFFKHWIKRTYVQYRNELRLGHACRLLIDTDLSITEIAMRSGFNNLSNFNEQFLRTKGMPPHAYRRIVLGQNLSTSLKKRKRPRNKLREA